MRRPKRTLVSASYIGRQAWTCWKKIAPGSNVEIGISFGRLGMIEVSRGFYPVWSRGTVRFEANGRYWYWQFNPCPSRVGLVRIARHLRLKVELLYDAETMYEANRSFMGKNKAAEFAKRIEALRDGLKGRAHR